MKPLNRRALFSFLALAFTLLFAPFGTAFQEQERQLRAEIDGPRSRALIEYHAAQGERALKIQVVDVPLSRVHVSFGNESISVPLNRGGYGVLSLDTRNGERVPLLKAGDPVAILSNGRVLMKGACSSR